MDKLDKIVNEQRNLLERLVEERDLEFHKDPDEIVKFHRNAILSEVSELQDSIDWKLWTNEKEPDYENSKEELIDILHFVIQGLICFGCDSDDIVELYLDKNNENHNRQDGKTERKGYNVNSDEKYENVD